jgi:hypothetical protein
MKHTVANPVTRPEALSVLLHLITRGVTGRIIGLDLLGFTAQVAVLT